MMVEVQNISAISIDKVRNARDQAFPIITGNQQLVRPVFLALVISSLRLAKIQIRLLRIYFMAWRAPSAFPDELPEGFFDVLELKSPLVPEFCGEWAERDSFESKLEDIHGSY